MEIMTAAEEVLAEVDRRYDELNRLSTSFWMADTVKTRCVLLNNTFTKGYEHLELLHTPKVQEYVQMKIKVGLLREAIIRS